MPNQVRVGVGVTGARGASSDLDRLRDKFAKLQKQGAKGLAIGAGFSLATAGINAMTGALDSAGDFIVDSIHKASDLNETVNKSAVVFGSSAGQIEQWGKGAAKSIGLSENAAVGAAATFGNLFESMGLGRDESAGLSINMVKLAGDLASFNNIDPTEALDKLQSGIVGETKAVRDLGIDISETTVTQELQREGVAKVNGEYTNGQKILARYKLIVQQTANAQGDFARTSDQVANSRRILNAEIENEQAALGTKLLPLERDWLGLQLRLITGAERFGQDLDRLGLFISGNGKGLADYNENLKVTEFAYGKAAGAGLHLNEAAGLLASAWDKGADREQHLTATTRGYQRAAEDAATATRDWKDDLTPLKRKLDDAASATSTLNGDISDLATSIFGVTSLTGDLAQAQKDLGEILKQGPESKKAQDVAIWKGQVADARQKVLELQGQLALAQGPQAFDKWLKQTQTSLGLTSGQTQDLINLIYQLGHAVNALPDTLTGAGSYDKGSVTGHKASGGYIPPNTLSWVGEQGPEIINSGPTGATVTNATDSAAMTGGMSIGPIYLTVNAQGHANASEVGRATKTAVADAMADMLREQNARYVGSSWVAR